LKGDKDSFTYIVATGSVKKSVAVFVAFLKQISEAPDDKKTNQINAFQLIGMASSLDLSGLFEEEVRKMQGWHQKGNAHT
jgi:hypothetical protein